MLLVALVLTATAKLGIISTLREGQGSTGDGFAVVAADLAVFAAVAALLTILERGPRIVFALTMPITASLFVLHAANASYVAVSGEQLDAQRLGAGLRQFVQVVTILVAIATPATGAILAAVVGVPYAALRAAARRMPAASVRPAAPLIVTAMVATVAAVAVPPREVMAIRRLQPNVLVLLASSWLRDKASPSPVASGGLAVPSLALERLASSRPPNIVLVVIESARWMSTSLSPGAAAATPALTALGERGTVVTTTRAVIPHTTKSVWSILCGTVPSWGPNSDEAATVRSVRCLPRLLAHAGYRTAFLQSARGTFEDRPRLVANLGFEEFVAQEDSGAAPLGYLASDDSVLAAPFADFVDRAKGRPFAAVVLTSATHHPYELSRAIADRSSAQGAARDSAVDRYHRMVEGADSLLGAIQDSLAARNLLESTIVLAVGDHGEGFGAHGVRQHDTDFYEEGLRVPWAMAGPGIPRRRIEGNASLLDVAPTVLDVLGVHLDEPSAGASVFAARRPAAHPFVCWFDQACRGYVAGTRKVVEIASAGELVAFDLDQDPEEQRARPASLDDRRRLEDLLASTRARHDSPPMPAPADLRISSWTCLAGRPCRHLPGGAKSEPPGPSPR